MGKDGAVPEPDPDLLIDFSDVLIRRSGYTLVGPVSWQVELDEKWVVLGPNGAGKTSLLRIAAAEVHPTSGRAWLGERLGRVDISELRPRSGCPRRALATGSAGREGHRPRRLRRLRGARPLA